MEKSLLAIFPSGAAFHVVKPMYGIYSPAWRLPLAINAGFTVRIGRRPLSISTTFTPCKVYGPRRTIPAMFPTLFPSDKFRHGRVGSGWQIKYRPQAMTLSPCAHSVRAEILTGEDIPPGHVQGQRPRSVATTVNYPTHELKSL